MGPPSQLTGVGTINTKGVWTNTNLTFSSPSSADLIQSFTLGSGGTNSVTVNLDMSNTANVGDLGVGYQNSGTGTLMIHNGGMVRSATGYLAGDCGNAAGTTVGGTATVDGAGSKWIMNGARLSAAGMVSSGGTAVLNVTNGGLVATTNISRSGSPLTIINIDNGTLQAMISSPNTYLPASTTVNIRHNGATFDTNGFNVLNSTAFVQDSGSTGGGFTKTGAGELILNGTTGDNWTGTTTVSGGALVASAATTILPNWSASGSITVASGAAVGGYVGGTGWTMANLETLRSKANWNSGAAWP